MTYLAHHGILGMKWGVRRYQNPDGTLTEAGKKRYKADGSLSYEEARLRSSSDKNKQKKYYDKLRRETDTRTLKGAEKAKREKEILEDWNNPDASIRAIDRAVELQKRISIESGDWYNSQPASPGFAKIQAEYDLISATKDLGEKTVRDKYSARLLEIDKIYKDSQYRDKEGKLRETPKSIYAFAKWDALYNKMRKEIKSYQDSDEYKSLTDRKRALDEELLGVVLRDIGYNDTPENRRLIESMIFID